MSVLSNICEHNKASVLCDKGGKESSQDYVKEPVRMILEEQVATCDPFNRERKEKREFYDKPRGNPYEGLKESELKRFIVRMKEVYRNQF